jgi:hypothetical protein
MLNEPAASQRQQQHQQPQHQPSPHSQPHPPPRLHTHPSYDARHAPERPPMISSASSYHGQPPPSNEYRTSANGSYFGVQSPHQNQNSASASGSASTPSATGQSVFAQSPGPHAQIHTPREGVPPAHPYQTPFVPSPSPSGPYPPTPGSVHHYPTSGTPSSGTAYQYPGAHPSVTAQSPSGREDYISANGNAHIQQRNLSPQAQFHAPPATPLGPPVSYPRPSPHPHRPTSHGQESVRRSSVGSAGSVQSRDYNQLPYDHSRTNSGSVQRTFSGDVRERERSIESVSPKTIPKPPPARQQSVTRYQEPTADPYNSAAQSHSTPERNVESLQFDTTPKSSSNSAEPRPAAQYHQLEPSPAPSASNHASITPQPAHTSLPPQQSPPPKMPSQSSLKRTASSISEIATTPLPPRKKARREEVPVWARSARRLPLFIIDRRPPSPAAAPAPNDIVKNEPVAQLVTNGQGQNPLPHAHSYEGVDEATIIGVPAYDDLARCVADWIYLNIGQRHPPSGGAKFEIEAKVGQIHDESSGRRIMLPVQSETVFDRQAYRGRTNFRSSMTIVSIFFIDQCILH